MLRHPRALGVLPFGFLLFLAVPAGADGKFYVRERVPHDLPYQRAVIRHDGRQELLIVQSKFVGDADEFGWVVPVPAEARVGCLQHGEADLFRNLRIHTAPQVIPLSDIFLCIALVLLLTAPLVAAMAGIRMLRREDRPIWGTPFPPPYGKLFRQSVLALIVGVIFAAFFVPTLLSSRHAGVDVLGSARVGVFETQLLRAETGEDIVAWLREHHFEFDEKDTEAFADYISRGWLFVTVRIAADAEEDNYRSSRGMVRPLLLSFPCTTPVYPLLLTGTGGTTTEVQLYVFAPHKVAAPPAWELQYAAREETLVEELLLPLRVAPGAVDPPDFLNDVDTSPAWLTAYRATLTSDEMSRDLDLAPAPDDEPFQPVRYR